MEQADKFLSPRLEDLHNPNLLQSMEKAVDRVHQAIQDDEKILIYGDYDADGVSSTAVMLKTLKEFNAKADYYIPNRFTEGYGPNEEAFMEAYKNGYSLIITVDTGIAAVHEVDVANKLGIDVIITDHHEIQSELPDAYAILHPKCSPDYPFKDLAGVGVAFKFAEALLGYFPEHLLPFAAIGTIADLVPLIGENRILAYHGLEALSNTKNPGIQALKEVSQIDGKINEQDVGFSLGPRINAVGRLQDASLAVELFMTEQLEEAKDIAKELEEINELRKQIVQEIVIEAEEMIKEEKSDVLVVAKEGWNEGVLGIVASKLVKKYDRPAIVLTIKKDKQEAKGSARSIPAFDLFEHGMRIRELFTHFGGHHQAAGMTLPVENISLVKEKLNQFIQEELTEEDFKQQIEIAHQLSISEISEHLIREMESMAPFGMSNPKPVFQFTGVPMEVRQIGSTKNHLKMLFQEDGYQLEGIGFGLGEYKNNISERAEVSIAGELGINEWNNVKRFQIMIHDMKIDEWQLFDFRGKRHFQPVLPSNGNSIAVFNEINSSEEYVKQITYCTDLNDIPETDSLYIYDLPEDMADLKKIVQKTKPWNIYVCYYMNQGAYLQSFPSREEFVWFYAFVRKHQAVDLKQHLDWLKREKGWSKEKIIFLTKVFSELDFVRVKQGVIYINPNPKKQDLQNSPTYQKRLKQMEIEKKLYYSNYDELKTWFASCMDHIDNRKEEPAYGL